MVSWKICLMCLVVSGGLMTASQAQNSVGGRVVNKRTGSPIASVRVLIQPLGGTALKSDETREDGFYLLNIPKSISKYVILFRSSPEYVDGLDCGDEDACEGIANTSEKLKRPDMELLPSKAAKELSPAALKRIIERQNRIIGLGDATSTPALRDMGVRTLWVIKVANGEVIQAARPELEERVRINAELDGQRVRNTDKTEAAKTETPAKEKPKPRR